MRLDLRADLETTRAAALAAIDRDAENVRLKFITPGSGQAMTYSEKRIEAERYFADTEIDPAQIPHIVAEAQLNGLTIAVQAQVILDTANAWTGASVAIETKRMAAKNAVRAAGTVSDIRAAAAVDWSDILTLLET